MPDREGDQMREPRRVDQIAIMDIARNCFFNSHSLFMLYHLIKEAAPISSGV
jgi:hypothetical protein